MSIKMPTPIAAYFAADQAGDAARLARCIAHDGVVRDEGGTLTGRVAIEQWNAANEDRRLQGFARASCKCSFSFEIGPKLR